MSTRRSRWAWVPWLLLGSMLLGLSAMAHVAVDDPHFALEPDYYDKAVHWDLARERARESRALGLRITPTCTPEVGARGRTAVWLHVSDASGAPFTGAKVEVQAFPNAFASRVQRLPLGEEAPGTYRSRLEQALPGVWELRVSVQRGSARYYEVLRVELPRGGAA